MARLILATPDGPQAIELRGVNSLGRHPNNSIQLLDKIVSKEHCIVEDRDGRHLLRDLGSLNGTYINGERVRGEQFLRHGDEVSLGMTRARFDDGSSPLDFNQQAVGPGAVLHPATHAGPPPVPSNQPAAFQAGQPRGGPVSAPMSGQAAPRQHWQQQLQPAQPPMGQMGQPGQPGQAGQPGRPPPLPNQAPQPQFSTSPLGPPIPPGLAPPGPAAPNRQMFRTRVDVLDSSPRQIGTQIAASQKGFLPFDQVQHDAAQLRLDYERLRLTWELTREIGLERDLDKLLHKILLSLFKFVKADRGVILMKEEDGSLQPRAAHRRDGTDKPIEVSSTILNHVTTERTGVLTHDASMDFAGAKGKSMILNRISSAIVVPLLHEQEVLGALWLDSEMLAQFQQKDLELITAVGNQASMFIENTLLAKKIEQEIVSRERFSRLLSPNVAEQVLSGKLEIKKGGIAIPDCTVFNSDIRGFTSMSEGAPAGAILDLLNEYFEQMVEQIFRYEGTLDKFMGDGIMAFWGAPVLRPDDAIRSVQCALDQMEALGRFNRRLIDEDHPPLAVGIGIHTGPLVAGYVGSSKALSYTVIGDTANTSARLCGAALAGQIIISESTLSRLGSRFEYDELPPAHLKGKEKPLRIFNIKRERLSAAAR
ncbi:MAG TPA: adenylate/guanylate cyclase domain-containing protein [Polyangiaceae bacterium]|nr:adenylate/guanylate cyclase domain-containing protein [Polyangiaceae bacterium]